MPLVTIERIPLPSLRTYTCISVVLLSVSVYYASQVSSDPSWKANVTKIDIDRYQNRNESQNTFLLYGNKVHNESLIYQVQETARFMIQEPLCIWIYIYIGYEAMVSAYFNDVCLPFASLGR